MPSLRPTSLCLLLALAGVAYGQPREEAPFPEPGEERLFGMEFEFAGAGNRVVRFEDMPWENYEKLMLEVARHYGDDASRIKRVDFTKPTGNTGRYPDGLRPLFRAEYVDPSGRKWMIEPEFVASSGYDGYELVTPPMSDPAELEAILNRVRDSGLVREGLKSGVHLNIDGRRLITPDGDARALANLILLHESNEPLLRRMFNPIRGGGHANRFARSLAVDHPELVRAIDALPEEERTRERLSELFTEHDAREAELHGVEGERGRSNMWKYRSMNLAKVLDINPEHNGRLGVVEFRMFDLHALEDPSVHRLEAELYRAMVAKAEAMAARGETVRYEARSPQPDGEDPSVYNTSDDPREARAEARELIESLNLDPERFEPLLERHIRPRTLPTRSEFRGLVDALPSGRVEHNGRAFTYGFELEGDGDRLALLTRPKSRRLNARWDSMSDEAKRAEFRRLVKGDPKKITKHFRPDRARFPWLDPELSVEFSSENWELRSRPFESLEEATAAMRAAKEVAGRDAKGFHLHLRDNGVDWAEMEANGSRFADFIERASNWVWLERAKRLKTMVAVKSWSNARLKPHEVEALANLESTHRATIRTTIPENRKYIDVEIRGLSTWVDDIESLAKITTNAMKTGEYGGWSHAENPLAAHRLSPLARRAKRLLNYVAPGILEAHEGIINENGVGRAPTALSFERHMEDYLRDVEGERMTPEMRKTLDNLQHRYSNKATGKARTFAANVAVPLLPWHEERSLPEPVRRQLRFAREDYLRSVKRTADKVMSGEYGLDLTVANEEGLMRHLKITRAEAKKLIAFRRAGGDMTNARGMAKAILGIGGAVLDHSLSRGRLRRLFRLTQILTRSARADGIDYDEVSKQVRYKVKKWAQETDLSEAMLRSLMPRPEAAETRVVARDASGEGEAFATARRVGGELQPSRISYASVSALFAAVREAAGDRMAERAGEELSADERLALERGYEAVEKLRLEIVETNDVLAERAGEVLRVSTGLLNQVHERAEALPPGQRPAFRLRVLGLILGHETAHAAGIRAEAVADGEGVRTLERTRLGALGEVTRAELKAAVDAFARPTGASHVDALFGRLRDLLRHGTARGRVNAMERAARGEADPLAAYRRADGTVRWKRALRDRALGESAGLAHFALALFLKEVAVVAATGDRARIEEFFDALATTDFYKHYGLFVAGARIGEVAYTRYLQRYVKPRFMNGLLKTNLVLAAGIALPLIVEGQFEGKAFAITVGSLGLSTAAVRSGVRGIRWVMDLKKARQTGALARVGVGASRLARLGGWFYTAVELAVILYVAEEIETRVDSALALREARAELGAAGETFLEVARSTDADAESLAEAARTYHDAWNDYRNFLYMPLHQDEALLAHRLEGLARRAKLEGSERDAVLERVAGHSALRDHLARRHGSVNGYADDRSRADEDELREEVETYLASYERSRTGHLREVYEDNRRDGGLLSDVEHLGWLLAGGAEGAEGDPLAGRSDVFARFARDRHRGRLDDALGNASRNRMQAYDDEAEVLGAVATALRGSDRPELAAVVDDALARVGRLRDADRRLMQGDGLLPPAGSDGLSGRVSADPQD